MAKSGVKKGLPKRTGKAQKLRMMENSKRRSSVKKIERRIAQRDRQLNNARILEEAFMPGETITLTQRRKALYG